MRTVNYLKKFYFWTTGYSYTNLGRLFLRLFAGIMLMQFGVRQWLLFSEIAPVFPAVAGLSPESSCVLMICVEIGCSLFIMAGFLTRIMTVPPLVAMIICEHYLLKAFDAAPIYMLGWADPGYLPVMFIGIYFFILLVGPGKISADYFLSLHIIHTDNKSESELEEV